MAGLRRHRAARRTTSSLCRHGDRMHTGVVKAVFHLSLRATQGFMESVVQLMGVELPVPDYTTVCKRQQSLAVRIRSGPGEGPRHVVIDSTGLEVYGAGQWNIRKHGMRRGRRRTWR